MNRYSFAQWRALQCCESLCGQIDILSAKSVSNKAAFLEIRPMFMLPFQIPKRFCFFCFGQCNRAISSSHVATVMPQGDTIKVVFYCFTQMYIQQRPHITTVTVTTTVSSVSRAAGVFVKLISFQHSAMTTLTRWQIILVNFIMFNSNSYKLHLIQISTAFYTLSVYIVVVNNFRRLVMC